jgi:hypothetical protein
VKSHTILALAFSMPRFRAGLSPAKQADFTTIAALSTQLAHLPKLIFVSFCIIL